jgi:hypothetical protein
MLLERNSIFKNEKKFSYFIFKSKTSSRKELGNMYSPFCVPAKVIKLVGLTRPPFLSPTNLITFAGTQNGEQKN